MNTATPIASEEEQGKESYWNRVLTGDPETVPSEVVQQAGADDADATDEENTYNLLSIINRSWYADHSPGVYRDGILVSWDDMRRDLANNLGVADDEREVFTALADEKEKEERRRLARDTYSRAYRAALTGADAPAPDDTASPEDRARLQAICRQAAQDAERHLARVAPLVDRVAEGMDYFIGAEQEILPNMTMATISPRLYAAYPSLATTCLALSHMKDADRRLLYYLAAEKARKRAGVEKGKQESLFSLSRRSLQRGVVDLQSGIVQGVGHIGVAAGRRLVKELNSPVLNIAADTAEGSLLVLDEMREAAQQEALPLELDEGATLAEHYFVEAMHNVPAAALSCCGGVGFGVLAFSGMGQSVAEARRRAPENSQELQLLAGAVGGCVQAGIYALMGRVGGRVLEQNLTAFARAHGKGVGAYSLAGLRSLAGVSAESAKLLLAGKAAQATELGAQELAAQLEGAASNINWQEFGDNMTDIEVNMREAAVNLPFVLMGAGKASLHHFRCRSQLLSPDGPAAEWGLKPQELERIAAEPDAVRSSEMMREAIRRSPRWNDAETLIPLVHRVLNLFHTQQFRPVYSTGELCDFLQMPSDFGEGVKPTAPPPARRTLPDNLAQNDEWTAHAKPREPLHLPQELPPPEKTAQCEAIVQQGAEDLRMLSYRRLLSAQAAGELATGKKALAPAEEMKREVAENVGRALVRCAQGELTLRVLMDLEARLMGDKPLSNIVRHYMLPRMAAYDDFATSGAEPHLAKQMAVLGTRRWVETLYGVMPRCTAFRELLTEGLSPAQAFAELSQRYFGSPPLTVPAEAESNAVRFARYSALTGREAESAVGPDGVTRWRARRPDGSYTPWHTTAERAVNDVVGNASLMFGGYLSTKGTNAMRPEAFSNFDQLGALAVQELGREWFGCATGWVPGVLPERLNRSMRGYRRGDGVTPILQKEERGPQQYTADLYSVLNPLSMMQARLMAYWRGQMEGGSMSAVDVMDFLQAHGRLTTKERWAIKSIAPGRSYYPPGGPRVIIPPNYPAMHNALAGRMAQYMTEYLVQHPDAVPLPDSVHRWLGYATMMPPYEQPKITQDRQSRQVGKKMERIGVDSNRLAALKVKQWAEVCRNQQQKVTPLTEQFFREHLQAAFTLPPQQQMEQGWAFHINGEQALSVTGHAFRRLLMDPGKELSRLTPEDLSFLEPTLATVCRDFPPPSASGEAPQNLPAAALRNLAEVLAEHPELHEYAPATDRYRVQHMQVKPFPELQDPGSFVTWATRDTRMQGGYTLETNAAMPEWMRTDPRAIPALHTLHALRWSAVDGPRATPWGILSAQGLIGGAYGRNPDSFPGWSSRPGLQNILRILDEAYTEGCGEPVSVCGVPLRGIDFREMDMRVLSNITVYKHPEVAGACFRLMPGEPELPSFKLSEPYLVKSYDGILCRGVGGIQAEELKAGSPPPESYAEPLRTFVRTRFQSCSEQKAYENTHAATTRAVEDMLDLGERYAGAQPDAFLSFSLQEGVCRLCEDTGFSYFLEGQGPQELSPGQARAVAWVQTMVEALGKPTEETLRAFSEACAEIRRKDELRTELIEIFNCERDPAEPVRRRRRYRPRSRYRRW